MIELDTEQAPAGQWFMPAYALFDIPGIDSNPTPSGPRRCGRERRSDGGPCRAWPRRGAPACAFHIKAAELAALEDLERIPAAA